MTIAFEVERTTFYELGGFNGQTLKGEHPTREEAFFSAVDQAMALAGPEREGYRRPTVSVVTNHDGYLAVQVGDGQEASYTMFTVNQCSWDVPAPKHNGRGYVVSHV